MHARSGEQVGAAEARALSRDEGAAVVGLRDELVAGREVEDDLRAAERERLRGLHGRPEVLADLDAEARRAGALAACEDEARAGGDVRAADPDGALRELSP